MSISHYTQSAIVRSLLMAIEDLQRDPDNRNNEVSVEMALREIEADLGSCVDPAEYEDTLGELGAMTDEKESLEEERDTLSDHLDAARYALGKIAMTLQMENPPELANNHPHEIADYVAECVDE